MRNRRSTENARVLFVDGALPDLNLILRATDPGINIQVIEPDQRMLPKLKEALLDGAEELHFVAHGSPGQIHIGADGIDLDAISLLPNASGVSANIYSCNVANEAEGQKFIGEFALKLNGSVSAATGKVGHHEKNASWDLDVTAGAGKPLPSAFNHPLGMWMHSLPNPWDGTSGNDVKAGTFDVDIYRGFGGDDLLSGAGGNDQLYGGDGDDELHGDDGADSLYGGNDSDILFGGIGNDILQGDAGADHIFGSFGNDFLDGGTGDDTFYFGLDFYDEGYDTIYGGDGYDVATIHQFYAGEANGLYAQFGFRSYGTTSTDQVELITGTNWNNVSIHGDSGDNYLNFASTIFRNIDGGIHGGDGNDVITGASVIFINDDPDNTTGGNLIYGDAGNDIINGRGTTDVLYGGDDDDVLIGGGGSDHLHGDAGYDVAQFSGNMADYDLSVAGEVTHIATSTTDYIYDIEELRFDDVSYVSGNTPPDTLVDADGATNEVSENAINGDYVGVIASATDPDSTPIVYSLDVNPNGIFAIDPTTGVVTVADASKLNFEAATSHEIVIKATDDNGNGSSRYETFTINILDGNDAPGTITDVNVAANTVAENSAIGTEVGITASSTDSNPGDYVSYALYDDAGGRFAIDWSTGVVTVANDALLDYESGTSYNIIVRATDSFGLETDKSFTINVSNVIETHTWGGATADADTFTATNNENWVMHGWYGNDTLTGAGGADELAGNDGDDILTGGNGADTFLYGGFWAGFDTLTGDTGTANTAVDTVKAVGDNTGIGLESFRSIEVWTSDGFNNVFIEGSANANTFNFSTATTFSGIAYIDGGDGNDTITGSTFADTIWGSLGDDTLIGHDGDDTFLYGYWESGGFDAVSGGNGTDTITVSGDYSVIGLTSISGVETITANGFAGVMISGNESANTLNFTSATITGITHIDGAGGNDSITGSAGDDTIFGGEGTDTLVGGGGHDSIVGGIGNDTLIGGEGNDEFLFYGGVDEGYDSVTGGNGTDTIKAMDNGVNIGLSVGSVENISGNGFSGVVVSFASSVTTINMTASTYTDISLIDAGTSSATITGDANDNTIRGNAGNDTINGGNGNDTFIYDGANEGTDTVTGGQGTDRLLAVNHDTVIRLASFATIEEISGDWYSNVTVAGTTAANTFNFTGITLSNIAWVDGDAGADVITGNADANVIMGSAGNDTLNGAAGDDVFLYTGAANDFDTVTGGTEYDVIKAMAADTVIGLATFTGTSTVEEITSDGHANVVIQGNTGANTLNFSGTTLSGIAYIEAGAGNDIITGSAGDDRFAFLTGSGSGQDTIHGGDGYDTIFALADNTNISLIAFSGVEEISADGHTGVVVLGSAGVDNWDFSGTTFTGIEHINMGSGNDTVVGSAGDDIFHFGTGGAFDNMNGGDGFDTIKAYANNTVIGFTAVSNFEEITANGYTGVTISGTTGNETLDFTNTTLTGIASINGGSGNDTILGSLASDIIIGGAGNDTLTGNGGADIFRYTATTEAPAGSTEVITDFNQGDLDLIDLSAIDASSSAAGNNTFNFIGSSAFSGTLGELRYEHSGGNTYIYANTTGNNSTEMRIMLSGIVNLTSSDFVL
jgi:Ca2+-binding RTX toxin-like protein